LIANDLCFGTSFAIAAISDLWMARLPKRRAPSANNINGRKQMNRLLKPMLLAAVTATLTWLPVTSQAQPGPGGGGGGGRNFDPAQMRQQMMDRYKEMLDVSNDDEWKAIEPRIQKVMDARRDIGFGGMRGMFGRGRGGPDNAGGAGGGGGNRGFGPQPSAAATDLQKAIDSKSSADTIKSKLAAYREERQQKQATLQKAQDDLKKVLSVKQEAAAVLAGLLD
jgi:hypothetical protein